MIYDVIHKTMQAGGFVMLPLFACGAVGFYLVLNTMNKLGRDMFRLELDEMMKRFSQLMNQDEVEGARALLRGNRGLVSQKFQDVLQHHEWTEHHLRVEITEHFTRLMTDLDKGVHMAGVMATTAPLLGLLGTVSGMIRTFEVLTTYGNSNPLLLADGISEALIATQSGLLIAIPLMLAQHRMADRSHWIRKQLEHGSTIILNWASRRDAQIAGNP